MAGAHARASCSGLSPDGQQPGEPLGSRGDRGEEKSLQLSRASLVGQAVPTSRHRDVGPEDQWRPCPPPAHRVSGAHLTSSNL